MELDALSAAKDDFVKAGAGLALISPQLPEFNLAITHEKKLDVEILSDPGNSVAAQYGLKFTLPPELKKIYQNFKIDVEKHNGDNSWTLPMPARLIIDRRGIVRHTDINVDYTIRPESEETLKILHAMD
jgi:peroxiredoxin